MRKIIGAIAVCLLAASPAWAWQEFIYLDQGFAIQFPARPTVAAAPYASGLAKGLKANTYTAEDDHVIYRMTVVELGALADKGSSFVNEAAYNLMREGDVIFNDFPRVYQDEKAVYGVTLVVDRPNGERVRTSIYYNKGRLYLAQADVTPARGDKDMIVPSRFDQTVRFPPDGRFD
jgi:hypothetical protein